MKYSIKTPDVNMAEIKKMVAKSNSVGLMNDEYGI